MQGKNYGYVRVSSNEQNERRQLLALFSRSVPKERIFMDKLSGKDFNRPQYRKLLKRLRAGDVLYITGQHPGRIDRDIGIITIDLHA